MTVELKPCPFCGGNGYITYWNDKSYREQYGSACKNCHVHFECNCNTVEEAIDQWNFRVKE